MAKKCSVYCHAYPGSGFSAGGETTLHDVNRALVARGWAVEVILSEAKTDGTTNDYEIDGVQVRAFTDAQQPIRLMRGSDLLLGHLGGAQRTALLGRSLKIPAVHLIHNDLDLTKGVAKPANYLIYNTDWVMKSFQRDRIIRPPGIVVHPPCDPERYQVRSKRKYITLVNLSNGGGGPYDKGAKIFYEMAARFPDEQFLGVTGAYGNQDIREMPNVKIVPNDDDIKKYYRETKLILSPSNYESYGRVAVEAACSGIPSITSRAPGFLEHSIGAHMVDYRDADAWESALTDVLGNYKAYSAAAKKDALALWEKSKGELDEMCRMLELLARRGR